MTWEYKYPSSWIYGVEMTNPKKDVFRRDLPEIGRQKWIISLSRIRKPGFLIGNWFRNKNFKLNSLKLICKILNQIKIKVITKLGCIENIFLLELRKCLDEICNRINIDENSKGIPFLRKMLHSPNYSILKKRYTWYTSRIISDLTITLNTQLVLVQNNMKSLVFTTFSWYLIDTSK